MPKLTKRVVDEAPLRPTHYFIWCSELPGFGVRIFPSGRRVYYADYRRDGKRRRMNIGPHGKITTEEARKLALALLGSVVHGEDPLEERRTRRKSITVAQLCDDYLKAAGAGLVLGRSGKPKKATTLETDRGRVERHIKPLLGSKRVADLQRSDVAKFIRDVSAGKTATVEKTKLRGKAVVEGGAGTATRTAGLLSGILAYAVTEGVIAANPVHGVARPAYRVRTRRLMADELAALGRAMDAADGAEPWQVLAGIRLLAFTACRLGEIAGLRWSEVDLEGRALRLGDSKTGASVRPLPDVAAQLLEDLPRVKGSPWVLPSVRDPARPISNLEAGLDRLVKAAKVERFTAHVLRHTFASVGGDLGLAEATIGALIGHAGHSITGRYIHRLDSVLLAAANLIGDEVARQLAGAALDQEDKLST